jgi:hypothetical protein
LLLVGTCLSSAELRRLMIKLGVHGAGTAGDHDLHKQGVTLAGRAQGGGKLIQKALDRRHEAAIKQFAKAKDEAALRALWDDAVKRGDIPGAYWAVLSHPAATDAVMRRVFGDVHMLSHMVGAANRADIRRLRQLEEDNAALSAKLEAQQRQLRDGFTARDDKIRLLNEALSRALAQLPDFPEELGLRVRHMLLSHHGRYEWGSPRRPKTLEAIALHHVENLSAQVNRFEQLLGARRGAGQAWTDYDRLLGRQLYAGHDPDLNIEEAAELE